MIACVHSAYAKLGTRSIVFEPDRKWRNCTQQTTDAGQTPKPRVAETQTTRTGLSGWTGARAR